MKKRYIALIILLAAATAVYALRASIALQLMPRLATRMMQGPTIEKLGPGLHVALCGAGGPLPDPARSGACVAVVAGGKLYVIDAGTNGARNLTRMGYPLGAIQTLFLTHFHSDHIDGLGEMAMMRWVGAANRSPLPVIGPSGVTEVVAGFNRAYAQDAIYRNRHHGDTVAPLGGQGMVAKGFPAPAKGVATTVLKVNGLEVQMITVNHSPVKPAVAYLFHYRGRSVLISGDTSKSDNLQQFAQGVDLLLHEGLSHKLVGVLHNSAVKTGNTRIAKITDDILTYHTSPVEAAEIARDAGVGHLLYYHVVPPLIFPGTEAVWLEGVDDVFQRYTLGRDGTTFSLPPDSDDIIEVAAGI